ncbi:MAG: hypothetical protein J5873_03470 [Bacteroidales bacterium]|nr:hypothetical protein [Bacteroidales bacterium]
MKETGWLKRSAALACDLSAAYLFAWGMLHIVAPPPHGSVMNLIWYATGLYFLIGHILWKRSLFQYLFRMRIQGAHWLHLGGKLLFLTLLPVLCALFHKLFIKEVDTLAPVGYDTLSRTLTLNWLGDENSRLCCGMAGLLLLGTAEACSWLRFRKSLCERLCKTRVVSAEDSAPFGMYAGSFLLFLLLLLFRPTHQHSMAKAHGIHALDAVPAFPPVACLEKQRYVRAFRDKRVEAESYLMGLFQRYDLVFIVEREHPECTQWDFFSRLILNDTFAEKIGGLCTEYGSCSMQEEADSFLRTDYRSDTARYRAAARILRQNSVWPTWYGRNIFDFIVRMQQYNSSRDSAHRIRWHLCDMPLPWEAVYKRPESYLEAQSQRDFHMGMNIVRAYRRQVGEDSSKNKMLVIVNYIHSIRGLFPEDRTAIDYVDAHFPGRVGVVYLPTVAFGQKRFLTNMHGGLWHEAAKEVGDCFAVPVKGTPLENEYYTAVQSPETRGTAKLGDKFDGFLFIGHPYRFRMDEDGYPYQFEGTFADEYLRRSQLLGLEELAKETLEAYRRHGIPEAATGHPYRMCIGYNRLYDRIYLNCTAVPLSALLFVFAEQLIRIRKKKKIAVS